METQWTVGPWEMELTNNATPHIFKYTGYGDEQETICYLPAEITKSYNSFNNSKLIALAPEMAEVIIEWESSDCPSFDWEEKMLAIAKRLRVIGG